MTSSDQRPPWYPRAAAAFRVAVDDEGMVTRANEIIVDTVDEFGPEVVPVMMLSWIDTALYHSGMLSQPGATCTLDFYDIRNRVRGTVETVPATLAWAGRVINARRAMDKDMFEALLNAAMIDNATWTQHVLVLLSVCVLTATHQPDDDPPSNES